MISHLRYQVMIVSTCIIWNMPSYGADVTWNGFGSIVGGKTVSEETLPDGSPSTFQVDPSLSGSQDAVYTDVLSFSPDTSFGLQLNVNLGSALNFVTQLTSRGGNDFEVEAEWLYISYEARPNLLIKAGRQRLALYNYSDYLDLGYSYHWLRPPIQVYGEGYTTYQGISVTHNDYLGDFDYSLHAFFGGSHAKTAPLGDGNLEGALGVIANIENEWLTFRLALTKTDFWLEQSALPEAIRFSERGSARGLTFSSVALFLNPGRYFIGAEMTVLSATDEFIQSGLTGATLDQRDSWMLSTGMHFGKLMPHLTLSERISTLTGHAYPAFNDLERGSKAIIIGARYDFHPKAALKFDYTETEDTSSHLLQLSSGKSQEVTAVSAGIDFIF